VDRGDFRLSEGPASSIISARLNPTGDFMTSRFLLAVLAFATQLGAQQSPDEAVIRRIVDNETATWNKGDAVGYSRDFAQTGTFTNIRGQYFVGHPAYLKQHQAIFDGIFKNSTLKQDVVSLRFIRPDVAVVETLTAVTSAQSPPGIARDASGAFHTRLLQVLAKDHGAWKIVVYHNTDVKPGSPLTTMK
jgi:uncharacterized protein (TIGR02246 family)